VIESRLLRGAPLIFSQGRYVSGEACVSHGGLRTEV
jgi:hypothetical protein